MADLGREGKSSGTDTLRPAECHPCCRSSLLPVFPVAHARVGRALTYFGAGPVPTVLVQHEPGDRTARAPLERDLRIGVLDEEVAGRLGPELHRPVPCARLDEERVALERHPQIEPRCEPVQTEVLR